MKRLGKSLFGLAALAAPLLAQTGVAVPELAEFDAAIERVIRSYQIPGAALAVGYQGRLIYARGFGLADRDGSEPVEPDSLFRVASVSKTINGIAAMKLVEQGKLRLDSRAFGDILASYAPPPPSGKLPVYDQITVRQLLQHTSGFPDGAAEVSLPAIQRLAGAAFGVAVPSAEQMVRWQLGQPLASPPGQTYRYTNGGMIAASRVIEQASGKPYGRFIREEVLAPAGITRTRLAGPLRRDRLPGEVRYHVPVGTPMIPSPFPGEGMEDMPYTINLAAAEGAGGWASSVVDLVRLLSRLNPSRPDSVLSATAFEEMIRRPPPPVSQSGNTWYGIGINVEDQGGGNLVLRHLGNMPGTNALVLRLQGIDLTIAALFNMRGPGEDSELAATDAGRLLATAVSNYVRTGRPWPTQDLFDRYLGGQRPRAAANGVVNAASFQGGAVAPGEVVTVFGEMLGGDRTTARVSNGRLTTELNGTRVLFDGVAAPLVYASAAQVSAIVPYGVSGRSTVRMEMERNGIRSDPIALPVTAAAPALFTANSSGAGPVAAQIFRDARIAVLYATGEGLVSPLPRDGEISGSQPLPQPILPVRVLLANREVPILYAGAAPGLTAGVMQINIQVPADLSVEVPIPIMLQVGTARSPAGVTLAFPAANFAELEIRNEDAPNGIYDPSLEFAADGTGWLAYSAVYGGPQAEIRTRIARSDDRGRTWTRVADANVPEAVTARMPDGSQTVGKWWHEVPTLVHDPGDPGREWKLYWHRYISRIPHTGPDDRLFQFGWIAYRHARSPQGPWSEEVALFGAGPFPLAPYQTRFKIGDLAPELRPYIALTEPGSLFQRGEIYLSLQAVRDPTLPGGVKADTILIASSDHGERWRYVNVVLRSEEAAAFGGDFFTGSSLVTENGRTFLLVCPEKVGAPSGTEHRGTLIFEFDDIARGTLRRASDGRPLLIKRIDPQLAMGGQSDYDAQNSGGILMPQFDSGNLPRAYRVFVTGARIVE